MLKLIGYEFSETKKIDAYYNGKLALKFDNENHTFVFTDVDKKNALSINNDDVLVSVNYPELSVIVKRDGIEKTLTGVLFKGYFESKNYLGPAENADAAQLKLRQLWMNN